MFRMIPINPEPFKVDFDDTTYTVSLYRQGKGITKLLIRDENTNEERTIELDYGSSDPFACNIDTIARRVFMEKLFELNFDFAPNESMKDCINTIEI